MSRKLEKAVRLYRTFHQLEPRRVGHFARRFSIPREAYFVGEAKQVLYRSDKLNPTTREDEGVIDYFHDHEGGVGMYRCDREAAHEGELVPVPSRIWDQDVLTVLGLRCLGFSYQNFDGEIIDANAGGRHPELYATPTGKALLVVQDKRRVQAIMWGGSLKVGWRGIEG